MHKTALIYVSVHHKNTEKLVTEACRGQPIDLFNISHTETINLSQYTCIGFASGIYMGKFHKSLFQFLKNRRQELPQKAFVMCTSGVGKGRYAHKFSQYLTGQGFTVLGGFECKGFDTFGPFKLFGGFAKGHPDGCDIANGTAFIHQLLNTIESADT